MKRYRKKPVVIEAVQWTGKNVDEIKKFMAGSEREPWMRGRVVIIDTLEGPHVASPGDYIIKGVHGEFYPCKPDIFAKTYEEVPDEN